MRKRIAKILLIAVVAALVAVVLRPARPNAQAKQLTMDFLDVGQGDSILLTTPSGYQILIDGGPDQAVMEQLRQVMPLTDRSIDMVLLSHPDADHLTGLIDVLKDYHVGQVLMPDIAKDTNRYRLFMALLQEHAISTTRITEPQDQMLPDGLRLRILHPGPLTSEAGDEANDYSIIARFDYGQRSFLFTGDIEEGIEERMIRTWPEALDTDFLKVPHHGSKTSSTFDFLQAVSPRLGVIQVAADNRYGHPSPLVLDRYSRLDIDVWRNDVEGSVTLYTDGQTITKSGDCPMVSAWLFPCQPQKVYTFSTEP